jgi:hypothetical protein
MRVSFGNHGTSLLDCFSWLNSGSGYAFLPLSSFVESSSAMFVYLHTPISGCSYLGVIRLRLFAACWEEVGRKCGE